MGHLSVMKPQLNTLTLKPKLNPISARKYSDTDQSNLASKQT